MSEMVERVAYATCTCIPCICKSRLRFEGMPCLERARKGIAAMRKPTDRMVTVGGMIDLRVDFDEEGRSVGSAAYEVWRAMIDEALK